jgi:hypothetical protein
MVLLSDSKQELWEWKSAILTRLESLRLTVHERSAQVLPVSAGIPWLGFVVFPEHRRLKGRMAVEATRHLTERFEACHAGSPASRNSTRFRRLFINSSVKVRARQVRNLPHGDPNAAKQAFSVQRPRVLRFRWETKPPPLENQCCSTGRSEGRGSQRARSPDRRTRSPRATPKTARPKAWYGPAFGTRSGTIPRRCLPGRGRLLTMPPVRSFPPGWCGPSSEGLPDAIRRCSRSQERIRSPTDTLARRAPAPPARVASPWAAERRA